MDAGRDRARRVSQWDLEIQNVFGLSIQGVSVLVQNVEIARVLPFSLSLAHCRAQSLFNEVRKVFVLTRRDGRRLSEGLPKVLWMSLLSYHE